jgi:hypothetical protein
MKVSLPPHGRPNSVIGIRTARPKYNPQTTTTPVITDARPCRLGVPGGYTRFGRPCGGNDIFISTLLDMVALPLGLEARANGKPADG